MQLRVLGAVDLVDAAIGPKERALLCRLVVAIGRPVSDHELIHALWPDAPPRTATKTLQGNILRLRKALTVPQHDHPIAIGSSPGGYVLTAPGPDSIDVVQFETLADVARTAMARRDHDTVATSLRAALALWQGAPFGEYADREWAAAERRRLEEMCVAAREDLVEAELARGRHHAVVADLEPMVVAEPLRERSWEQLALALYRCGRQADALRAIQRARSMLTQELGVEPGPALRGLEKAILAHDVSLDLGAVRTDASTAPSRRTATFLFTDIVGSTERWERDALDMRVALDRHDGLLRASIGAHGGEVFKSVGDALHAVFTTASAAIEAAVAGARGLLAEDWKGEPVEVRMAVYTGEAEAVKGDWFGRPLNRCSRLLAAAGGGQVLVSHTTARLAENELGAGVHLVGLGAYRFRGVDRTEDVYQVVAPGLVSEFGPLAGAEPQDSSGRDSATETAPVLPSSLAGHVAPVWVGRDDELDVLRSAWRDASSGTYQTVLIAGEPGAGKTALAARFASEVAQGGAWVLHGHCDEEALVSYRAFGEALDQLVASAGGSVLAEHTTDHGGDLCSVVPQLARRVPGLRATVSTTPEADRSRLAAAVIGLLEAGARQRPILVVFDDLHWADSGTVGLLRDLVHRAPNAPLVVVATYRSTDVERQQPSARLLADLRREAGVTRVALTGLSEPEVAELVCGVAGQSPGDDGETLAASLRRDTGGNPFFIIEVLRHLIETGVLEVGDGRRSLDPDTVSIPEGIREVVGRRLDRLGVRAAEVLRTAAVIGPRFDLRLLAEVLDIGQDEVLESLELASAADLVAEVVGEVDRWQFTHELVRRTLIDQLSLSRSTRVHRTVGEVLERLRPRELAALAHHFAAAAGLGDVDRAIHYAFAAADQAAANAAHADAARLLERGMDAADASEGLDDIRRIELMTRIGSEQAKAADPEAALVLLSRAAELAREVGSAELFAEAVLARTNYGWSFEADNDEQQLISEALAADPPNPKTRARLLAARARMEGYSVAPASQKRAHVAEAIAAARIVGDPETLGAALMSSVYLGFGPDDLSARQILLDELAAAAKAANRPDWEAMTWAFRSGRHLMLGQYAQAQAADLELERLTTASREPFAVVALGEVASRRACTAGDFAEAERLAAEQMALGARIGISRAIMEATVAGLCAPVWNLQHRLDDLAGLWAAVPNEGEYAQLQLLWTASVRARQGRVDEAAAALGEGVPSIEHGRQWGASVEEATTAIVSLNDPSRAAALLQQLDPYRDLDCVWETMQYRGAVVHHIGRLLTTCERYEEAVEHLNEACDRYGRLNSPPWLVLVRRDLARALRGRGRPTDRDLAKNLEHDASQTARRLGMPASS